MIFKILENSTKNPNPTAYGAFIASYVHTNLRGGSDEIPSLKRLKIDTEDIEVCTRYDIKYETWKKLTKVAIELAE